MQGEDETRCEENSWLEPEREPTEQERRRMWAAALVAVVVGAMSNHTYLFKQETRRQKDADSIGNVLTGEVADCCHCPLGTTKELAYRKVTRGTQPGVFLPLGVKRRWSHGIMEKQAVLYMGHNM